MKTWELVNFCEFDKYAVKSYCAIHNETEDKNLGDITKVDETKLKDFNMMTWGFPCTDISLAGKQKGFIDENGEKTRSGMYYEGIRILKYKKPTISIIENVKNLTSKKFEKEFKMILKDLNDAGYNSYWKILNAKNYGIPQNRERVFIVSIRKDLDNGKFNFPKPIKLKNKLEDYIDFREKDNLTNNFYNRYKEIKNPLATLQDFINYINSLPNTNGIGGKKMKLYNFGEMDFITNPTGITGTLTCRNVQNYNKKFWYNNRLYKPSPKMCFKLMGFDDEDFYKSKIALNDNDKELYNRAGNSIVVNVPYEIYKELYKSMPYLFNNLKLLSLFSGIGAFEKALDKLYEDINNEKL